MGPTILMPKRKHHLQQVTAFTAPKISLHHLQPVNLISVSSSSPPSTSSLFHHHATSSPATAMRTSVPPPAPLPPSWCLKNIVSPAAFGFHRLKKSLHLPTPPPPRFQIAQGCIGRTRDPQAWCTSWFMQLLLLAVISLLFLAASVSCLGRRCGAVEDARRHQGPYREWDDWHASEGRASWEEAKRRDDTEESRLQPSLQRRKAKRRDDTKESRLQPSLRFFVLFFRDCWSVQQWCSAPIIRAVLETDYEQQTLTVSVKWQTSINQERDSSQFYHSSNRSSSSLL
jgi:hypothetical protein